MPWPKTYYVALPFIATDGLRTNGCLNLLAAVARAEALSRKHGNVGAVAFSRTGAPAMGDFGDAKVLPDDLSTL